MKLFRESKLTKTPAECKLRINGDCEECDFVCKLSLHCTEHELTNSECVDCAWDLTRNFDRQIQDLHRILIQEHIWMAKLKEKIKNQNNNE